MSRLAGRALQRRMRKASRAAGVFVAGTLLLAITACAERGGRAQSDSSVTQAEKGDPESLFRAHLGLTWELVRLGTQDIPANPSTASARDPRRHPGPGSRPTIRFTADRAEQAPDSGMSSAGGWSFCNGYGAAYRAGPGDALRFQQFHSTLVGCNGPDSLESRYFRALGNTRRFAFDSTTLRLIADDGSSLVFEPFADPAGPASR